MLAVKDVSYPTLADALRHLHDADRLLARAIEIIATNDAEAETGLSAELVLQLDGRRTRGDARMLVLAARMLRALPITRAAFARGDLSWAEVRTIVLAARTLDARGRDAIDTVVARSIDAGTEALLEHVDHVVAQRRADLARAREDRRIASGFLAVQARLDGTATFYGEADAASAATILEALDAAAPRPLFDDGHAPTRAQQRLEALIAVCEGALAGSHASMRPRPRLIARVDIADAHSTRALWALAGRAPRLTPLATEELLCDATIVPVMFDGARPIAVGDATANITPVMRAAVIARDGGCRFPGCSAPVAWCDAHHIRARIHDGPTIVDNLLLLCRRCHRRVHRARWRIERNADGTFVFRRRGRTYVSTSSPVARRE